MRECGGGVVQIRSKVAGTLAMHRCAIATAWGRRHLVRHLLQRRGVFRPSSHRDIQRISDRSQLFRIGTRYAFRCSNNSAIQCRLPIPQQVLTHLHRTGTMTVRLLASALLASALSAGGCSVDARRAPPSTAGQQPHLITVAQLPAAGTGASIEAAATEPEDGQWIRPAKDFASSRYSGLSEITAANVSSLKPAWTFDTGVRKGQEAAPLVVGSTMYVVTPYPNILFALDLAKPGAPPKWTYHPKPLPSSQGEACCDVVNRGPVVRGRENHLRDARQYGCGGRRRKRCAAVAHAARQHRAWRDDDDGAADREGSRAGGKQRRRVGCARMDEGARREDGRSGVDGDEHRARIAWC